MSDPVDANALEVTVQTDADKVDLADAATLASFVTSLQPTMDALTTASATLSAQLGDPHRKVRAQGCQAMLSSLLGEYQDMATTAAAAAQPGAPPAQV